MNESESHLDALWAFVHAGAERPDIYLTLNIKLDGNDRYLRYAINRTRYARNNIG